VTNLHFPQMLHEIVQKQIGLVIDDIKSLIVETLVKELEFQKMQL